MAVKLGMHKAKNLLPGDITSLGEVVECRGVGWRGIAPRRFIETPGCCDVFYRKGGETFIHRYLLDEPVEVLDHK